MYGAYCFTGFAIPLNALILAYRVFDELVKLEPSSNKSFNRAIYMTSPTSPLKNWNNY